MGFIMTTGESLDARMLMVAKTGERHLRHLIKQFIEHYLTERYHQGIGSQIIKPKTSPGNDNAMLGPIECRSRLGGLLNYYYRQAA